MQSLSLDDVRISSGADQSGVSPLASCVDWAHNAPQHHFVRLTVEKMMRLCKQRLCHSSACHHADFDGAKLVPIIRCVVRRCICITQGADERWTAFVVLGVRWCTAQHTCHTAGLFFAFSWLHSSFLPCCHISRLSFSPLACICQDES